MKIKQINEFLHKHSLHTGDENCAKRNGKGLIYYLRYPNLQKNYWHSIGTLINMKILNMHITPPLNTTQKLVKAILVKNIDAFKLSHMQFLRNNPAYNPNLPGLIA